MKNKVNQIDLYHFFDRYFDVWKFYSEEFSFCRSMHMGNPRDSNTNQVHLPDHWNAKVDTRNRTG